MESTAAAISTASTIAWGAGGIEHRFGPALLAGVAVGYARSNYDADQISGSGSIDTGSGGLYASYAPGNWYVDGLLGYGFSDGSLDRSIVFPGVARRASGDPNANAFLSSIETGYSIVLGRSTMVTPLAALQGIVIFQNDLSETGAGAINLLVEDENTSSAQSLLGAELTQALPVGLGAPLLLKLRAGWGHELADVSRSFTAGFEGLPGATAFTVAGVNAPRDVAVIELLASLTVRQSFDLYLRYDGAFASDASTQGGSAGLRFVF